MRESTSIGVFTPEDARFIKNKAYSGDREDAALFSHKDRKDKTWHYAVMKGDLAPATDPLEGYTTAKAAVLMYKQNEDTLNLEEITVEELEIDVINRNTSAGLAEGDFVVVKWFVKEWMPLLPAASTGQGQFIYGIVRENLCNGYYNVEIANWSGVTPEESSSAGACGVCSYIETVLDSSGYSDCLTDTDLPQFAEANPDEPIVRRQVTGLETIVLAFDFQSRFVPLEIWSDCLMVNVGAKNSIADTSLLSSSGDEEDVYMIIRGHQQHLKQYIERKECCELTQEWKLVERRAVVFPGVLCDPETCEPCPV